MFFLTTLLRIVCPCLLGQLPDTSWNCSWKNDSTCHHLPCFDQHFQQCHLQLSKCWGSHSNLKLVLKPRRLYKGDQYYFKIIAYQLTFNKNSQNSWQPLHCFFDDFDNFLYIHSLKRIQWQRFWDKKICHLSAVLV